MLKSAWAYHNGKRIMREAKPKVPKWGFLPLRSGGEAYAEKSGESLYIKMYANKTQAEAKVLKLKEKGIDVYRSFAHPFKLIKLQETN